MGTILVANTDQGVLVYRRGGDAWVRLGIQAPRAADIKLLRD